MKFLKNPNKQGNWVASQDELDKDRVRSLILSSDICLSDLDDTDAKSPARAIVLNHLFSRKAFNQKFINWCIASGLNYWNSGKSSESDNWQNYVKLFLNSKERIDKAKKPFEGLNALEYLYEGILILYHKALKNMHLTYLSRNLAEIIHPFAKILNFDEVIADVKDKEKAAEDYIKNNTFKRYFLKGDSEEDEDMLDVLNFYKKKGQLEEVVSCYRANNANNLNPRFNINVGENYNGLVDILLNQ